MSNVGGSNADVQATGEGASLLKAGTTNLEDNVACVPSAHGVKSSMDEANKADHSTTVLVIVLTVIVLFSIS